MELVLFKSDGIIPIYQNETQENLVNARELHEFLGVGRDFSNWIKDRVQKYDFVENVDYVTFAKIGEREIGATTRIEYILKMDTAKEIAMVENNEKGKQVRKYFIEVEKKAKELAQITKVPKTYLEALEMATEIEKRRLELQQQMEANRPKVIFAEALEVSENTILIGQLAKIIKQNGIEIGEKRLFSKLREEGYLGKRGEEYNIPTHKSIALELFKIKTTTINNANGKVRVVKTTKVTGKGQNYFINKFKNLKEEIA